MKTKDLIDYLTSQGFNVFPQPNFIPGDIKESQLPALFVFGTGGFSSHDYLPVERPTFQVIVKGQNFKQDPNSMTLTEQEAKRLINHLDKKTNYAIGSTHVYLSRSNQSHPIPLGVDDKDRPTFSINFTFRLTQ